MVDRSQVRTYRVAECVTFRSTKSKFGGLSNMAGGFPLRVNGILVPSAEAIYQACRFPHRPEVQKLIIAQHSPMTAKMVSKPYRDDSRTDWAQVRVRIMRWVLRVKLAMHWPKFSELLLATGEKPIVEDSRRDDFWGALRREKGALVGMNVLGRLLMELREELKGQNREALRLVAPPAIQDFVLLGNPIGKVGFGTGPAAGMADPDTAAPSGTLWGSRFDETANLAADVGKMESPTTSLVTSPTLAEGHDTRMIYPKRLIEVDLPIARISAHSRREKSIRHGHISTLHIWWARRPLAACRAVICAALWPDPAGENCPQAFRDAAARHIMGFARRADSDMKLLATSSEEGKARWAALVKTPISPNPTDEAELLTLRAALLDFIADFANWDNSTVPAYLETARALTQAAHEALGGEPGTRPLVVDPFAGGGSIPLEALRVGADAFASDLNPIPVLLNKVVLEYIPKYGQRLADTVRAWGNWIWQQAKEELAKFYPEDKDGSTPIAYLWARTILSQAPGQGDIPYEVPLMRSMWLAKKAGRKQALRWVRDDKGLVKTQTVEVAYAEDGQRVTRRVKRPLLDVFAPIKDSEVEVGTVARGSATCPVTGYTTKVDSVRAQLKKRRGGAADSRLFCVVTTRDTEQGRFYRLPTKEDQAAFAAAAAELERRERADGTERSGAGRVAGHRSAEAGVGKDQRRSLVPDEVISLNELRRVSVPIYGMERWGDLFSPRQALALTTLTQLVRETGKRLAAGQAMPFGTGETQSDGQGADKATMPVEDVRLAEAVMTCLGMVVGRLADKNASLAIWNSTGEKIEHVFGRQAIGMAWDYPEVAIFSDSTGNLMSHIDIIYENLIANVNSAQHQGHVEQATATAHPLPDDAVSAFITDPPYYDAVPYAYLSDFFYVWMRRTLADVHTVLFREAGVPKDAEIVVDRPHKLSKSSKDITFYECELTKAFAEGRRVLAPTGVGTIVFASKTTASWEAILKSVIDAGFIITGSWPIDTEREARVAAQGQARLGSSVHLVCRPRENPDGSLREDDVGEWRDVLLALPKRIHEWMPRLAAEGVVGADAIFACLGPALEIFSRHSRVEKSSGEAATLKEYLEHVWAAVSTEALSMIFMDADAAGLEPDARLTAIWLWTLGGGSGTTNGNGKTNGRGPHPSPLPKGEGKDDSGPLPEGEEEGEADEDEKSSTGKGAKISGFVLEFDAARKIAQGLGVHLDKSASIVEVKGEKARLLPVAERTQYLFGKAADAAGPSTGRKREKAKQKSFFDELDEAEAAEAGWGELKGPSPGSTVLDRLHQTMILFAAGRGELLKRFLVDEGIGADARFWRLAQSLSALYPRGSDEKRWVDGVLARKKGLGL